MNSAPILYVEDEENDVFFLERAFRKTGLPIPLANVADGRLALEYLSGEGVYRDRSRYPLPRLALVDLKLPRVSGLELLEWIRRRSEFDHLPVIMLTSSNQKRDLIAAYDLGANGYVIKPGNSDKLIQIIRALEPVWLSNNPPGGWLDFHENEPIPTKADRR